MINKDKEVNSVRKDKLDKNPGYYHPKTKNIHNDINEINEVDDNIWEKSLAEKKEIKVNKNTVNNEWKKSLAEKKSVK